jgi:hypothetical protein
MIDSYWVVEMECDECGKAFKHEVEDEENREDAEQIAMNQYDFDGDYCDKCYKELSPCQCD